MIIDDSVISNGRSLKEEEICVWLIIRVSRKLIFSKTKP